MKYIVNTFKTEVGKENNQTDSEFKNLTNQSIKN